MKKVLILKKDIKDTTSGAPRIVFDQIRFFTTQGFDVHVCAETILKDEVIKAGGTPHKTFKWPKDGHFRRKFFAKQAAKLQKKLKPVLTIGHGDTFNDDVSYIHNIVHLAHQAIHEKPIAKDHPVALIHEQNFKEQNFKLLVANSKMMKNDLSHRFGIPEAKMIVEYPKYDQGKFSVQKEARDKMRAQLGYKEDELVIGLITSGNFKKRNIQFFLEVVNRLKDSSTKNFKILIAGKNKESKYQDYVNQNNLEDIVQFAPSILNVEEYYNAIDIFILPARIEEFGLSVVEAIRCGNPVVVSNTVGSGELLTEEYENYRLNIDHEKFEKALNDLLESKELREKLIIKGKEITDRYPKEFSFDHLLEFTK